MIKTFFQFDVIESDSHGRVAVVSGGDHVVARDWLTDARFGGMGNDQVASHPRVVYELPSAMIIEPVDTGKMTSAWSSWRVTDYVYGLSDHVDDAVRAQPDGIVMTHNHVEGDFKGCDVTMAVGRLLTQGYKNTSELVDIFRRHGVWFAGVRVRLALHELEASGRITRDDGRWYAEVRR